MARANIAEDMKRVKESMPEEAWKPDHLEAMQVRDLEDFLDGLGGLFRRVKRLDEGNHLSACQPDAPERDFQEIDEEVMLALDAIVQWAETGIRFAEMAHSRGYKVEHYEQTVQYMQTAKDMMAAEPSFMHGPEFEAALGESEKDIEAGEIEGV